MEYKFKNINVTYFSGTGGTEKIAFLFKNYFEKNGNTIEIHSINTNYLNKFIPNNEKTDLIILLCPVYAFDFPQIIYNWCKLLPNGNNAPIVVISVSGGGEVWSNNACRMGIIKKLKRKNYSVIYEAMLQMPSNFMVETPEKEALKQIKELPDKIKIIISEILSGKEKHRKPEFGGKILMFLLKIEKIAIWLLFGKSLRANSKCTKCNLCINNCPKNNIVNNKNKILFKYNCEGCFKCIYECPNKAIYSKFFQFILLKNGYSIKRYENKLLENNV